jgi:hypothetical protein
MEALVKMLIWAVAAIVIYGLVIGAFAIGRVLGIDSIVTGTALAVFSVFIAAERILDAKHTNAEAIIQSLMMIRDRLPEEPAASAVPVDKRYY